MSLKSFKYRIHSVPAFPSFDFKTHFDVLLQQLEAPNVPIETPNLHKSLIFATYTFEFHGNQILALIVMESINKNGDS